MVGGTERPEQPAMLVLRRVPFDGVGGAPDRGDAKGGWRGSKFRRPKIGRRGRRAGSERTVGLHLDERWSHEARMIGEIFRSRFRISVLHRWRTKKLERS
ncbi:hypothetical protein GW17_00021617 [Ensete ventricosum]|nr:hypothetical protein GW17_00021617 [Ensete ventricosum]